MLFPRPSSIRSSLLIPVLLVFGTSIYIYHTQNQIPVPDYNHIYNVAVSGKKGAFVQQYLDVEIDGQFDISPLETLCRSRERTPGLIAKCMPSPGGIGNVRNMILNCLRFAFEAGG
jgi:hypothetical protein